MAVGQQAVVIRSVLHREEQGIHTMQTAAVHLQRAESTGKLIARCLREGQWGTCAVLGGDTLRAILQALDISHMQSQISPIPGFARISASLPAACSVTFFSKPGGFGDAGLILRLIHCLTDNPDI